jgi:hypothetical protein
MAMVFGVFFSRALKLAKMIAHEVREHALNSLVAIILGMIFVWLLPISLTQGSCVCHPSSKTLLASYKNLPFHLLHYVHTFFASITATLTAMRFSKNLLKSALVGVLVPPVFCTLSDILFPYWGGKLAGIQMTLHLCVVQNILPVSLLIFLGVTLGLIGSSKTTAVTGIRLAASSHFLHDFVSAAASISYLVSFGYDGWTQNLGYVFLLMLVAVLIPCMLSDFVLPMLICAPGQISEHHHDHNEIKHGENCAYKFYEQPIKKDNCNNGRN